MTEGDHHVCINMAGWLALGVGRESCRITYCSIYCAIQHGGILLLLA